MLTFQIVLLLGIVFVAVVLFSVEQLPADVTAMGLLLILILTGLLPADQAFDGFGSDAVIMIFGLLVLTNTLTHTGVVDSVDQILMRLTGKDTKRLLAIIMLVAALLSAFISNTATTALFVPVTLSLARRLKVSASKLLMPLAFASILSSSVTLISSSTNIIISDLMTLYDMPPMGMFELTLVGLPIAVIGLLYMLSLGYRLIPERGGPEEKEEIAEMQPYLSDVSIIPGSPLVGKTLKQAGLGRDMDLTVLRVVRGKNRYLVPQADLRIKQGDKILIEGPRNQLLKFTLDNSLPIQMLSAMERAEQFQDILTQFDQAISSLQAPMQEHLQEVLQHMRKHAKNIGEKQLDREQLIASWKELSTKLEDLPEHTAEALETPKRELEKFLVRQEILPSAQPAPNPTKPQSTTLETFDKIDEKLQEEDMSITEVILLPRSPFIGRTLKGMRFRQKYGLQVLGINRRGKNLYRKLSDISLRTGDQLLIHGPRANIATLNKEGTFRVIGDVDIQLSKRKYAPVAIAIFVGVLLLSAINILPLPVAVWLGALLTFVTGCINPNTAYRAVEWKILMVIGSMLAIGRAMEYTGTAEFLATQIISLLPSNNALGLLSVFFGLTMLLTQPMSNQAAAAIVLPIAMETAMQLGLNPRTFAIMIATGASCSFITPLEPACLMIYGPGRYKFSDFIKVGFLLTLLIYILVIILVPWIWPL